MPRISRTWPRTHQGNSPRLVALREDRERETPFVKARGAEFREAVVRLANRVEGRHLPSRECPQLKAACWREFAPPHGAGGGVRVEMGLFKAALLRSSVEGMLMTPVSTRACVSVRPRAGCTLMSRPCCAFKLFL
jgi:hypothetical protein